MKILHGNIIIIPNVAGKISKSIGVIYKSNFCLPVTSLSTLYYSLVYPRVYCASVSIQASTYPTNLNCIVLLQKKNYLTYFQEAI